MGLLPKNSEILQVHLKTLKDNSTIWTDFGIRSLSIKNIYFGQNSNYWTGPIWIQINYLILKALKKYYFEESKEIYTQLRKNILQNLIKHLKLTGRLWETYNPINGNPERGNPFCGWSCLFVLILNENY